MKVTGVFENPAKLKWSFTEHFSRGDASHTNDQDEGSTVDYSTT